MANADKNKKEYDVPKDLEYLTSVKGGKILVDSEDLEMLMGYGWKVNRGGYAYCQHWNRDEQKYENIYMHRLLTNAPKGLVVDHMNHKRLDNRKSNLRVCTHADNMRNLEKGRGCIQRIVSTAGNIFYRGKIQQKGKEHRTSFVRSRGQARHDLELLKISVLGEQNGAV